MYFYLSIGTNVNASFNASRIVHALCEAFGEIVLYPFSMTKPENIVTEHVFLNSLAIIQSQLSEPQVKHSLNEIEIMLGRNRQDPMRSHKDRPADIDILHLQDIRDINVFNGLCEESYVQDIATQSLPPLDLSRAGLPAIKRPSTVYLDSATRNIRVIQQAADSQINRMKSSLSFN